MPGPLPRWKRYFYALIAAEISSFTRYYDRLVQWGRTDGDDGHLLAAIDCPRKSLAVDDVPDVSSETDLRTAVLLFGTINHHYDIEALLVQLHSRLSRTSRGVIVAFNPYLQWLYRLALSLGLKKGAMPTTFVTVTDLRNICKLSRFEIVRIRPAVYCPWCLLGLGSLINYFMPAIPLLRHLAFTAVIVIRPLDKQAARRESLTVVVPARNERGNIAGAIERMPALDADLEVIFVEGHSTDGTWDEIQRVAAQHNDRRMRIRAYQQTGRGKADAVRLGFAQATGDLLTILDADLTMPPELLPRFVNAYLTGKADFINGTRITYPMEGEAMRFLNRLGNVFFAKALTWILDVRLGDCLCGTKLVARHDYARMQRWRADFGDFDPFGDFELLFPAAVLGLGTIDVPIRYRARTYGATNISRFRHGLMLFKMTLRGFTGIKAGRLP